MVNRKINVILSWSNGIVERYTRSKEVHKEVQIHINSQNKISQITMISINSITSNTIFIFVLFLLIYLELQGKTLQVWSYQVMGI